MGGFPLWRTCCTCGLPMRATSDGLCRNPTCPDRHPMFDKQADDHPTPTPEVEAGERETCAHLWTRRQEATGGKEMSYHWLCWACGATTKQDPNNHLVAPSQSPQGSELGDDAVEEYEHCDCTELCSMGPTCPGASPDLPGAGCWRTKSTPVRGAREILIDRYLESVKADLIAAGYVPLEQAREREAAAWDRCLGEVFQRLYDSVSHGTERGEPWVPWLVSLVKSLRDDQPIPNPFRQEA